MQITCWGARGSVPVSGPEFIKYGGNTTCLEIRSQKDRLIIIDAGTGLRELVKKTLQEDSRTKIDWLFTHLHWDHVLDFPYFIPILTQKTDLNIHNIHPAHSHLRQYLTDLMKPPYFPLPFEEYSQQITFCEHNSDPFFIDSMLISSISLSHPNGGMGYKFSEQGKSFVFLTDNELGYIHPGGKSFADYVAFCSEADLLIHDAEYTENEYQQTKTWGHSTIDQTIQLASQAGVKELGLFHHNRDRSDGEIDDLIEVCRKKIDHQGCVINCLAVAQGDIYSL